MLKKSLLVTVALALGSLSLQAQHADLNIIPAPAHVQTAAGSFQFTPATTVAAKGEGAAEAMQYLTDKVRTATGVSLKQGKAGAKGCITFVMDPGVKGAEAYTLEVTADRVTAKASTGAGMFYAVQSLLQLMPPAVESGCAKAFTAWQLPAVSIADAPRFAYRGVMLDPCRHFLPVEAVKRQIDLLAAYKINKLHWHLTEDQGWRVEIKKYPLLTQIGSQRLEAEGTITKGYYTQEEVKDVVAYAAKHHIEVIPELEIPGHELAAISAYPELSCQGQPTTPRIIWGVEDIVMCPGKELMFNFLQDVIDELAPLFPSQYFHIGGDESPRGEWAKCPRCQARMKELGYTKEAQLQSYVVGRVEKYLRTKGKRIIGWDEILEGGNLDTTAIVMSWRGEEGGITAAKAGHHVLMTPAGHGYYFDFYQGDPLTEPIAFGGHSTLEKVYSYNPVPAEVHAAGRDEMVLGIQANAWSEYIFNPQILEYRLYPRALALAEVGWSAMERKDFKDFCRRVDNDAAQRLDAHHVNYHIPEPEQPGGSCNYLTFENTDTVTLQTSRPLTIVYTTDGSVPTAASTRYTAPIVLDRSTLLRTAAVLPTGKLSAVRDIRVLKAKPTPAVKVDKVKPGLLLTKWDGDFRRPCDVAGAPAFTDSVVAGTEVLRGLTEVPASVRNVNNYAAAVEGYIQIPETGVYEFTTINQQLFIDNVPVIDNTLECVPRHTHQNRQLILEKGLHPFRATFLGGVFNGWPTYWNDGVVSMRPEGGEWKAVSADMLFHEAKCCGMQCADKAAADKKQGRKHKK